MKVLVHIGSPKAGSSSIQNALRRNAGALLDHGVLAWEPDASRGPPPRTLSNRFEAANRAMRPRERLHFRTSQDVHAWSLQNWDQMARDVQAHRPALTVLSSEGLFGLAGVQKVLDALQPMFTDIHILAYVRDPVDQYRSSLDQRIRDGARFADLPLPVTLAPRWHKVMQRYRRKLGADHLILRPFDRAAFTGGDLITDFAARIGDVLGRPVDMAPDPVASNESLCAAATLWLMGANEAFVRYSDADDSEQVRRRLALVQRLRGAPSLQDLPKLGTPPDPIAESVRLMNADPIAFFNATQAGKTHPLRAGTPGFAAPSEDDLRQVLRDWLMRYGEPQHLARVLDAAISP